jgi:signal transduction histidine kinase
MSKKPDSRHGGASSFAVSAWPLSRKVALALAIPLLLAATLGGLRVQNDLSEARNLSTSAQQVTVLDPAIAYLVAAEKAMVAAHVNSTDSGEYTSAVDTARSAAQDLERTARSADLSPAQAAQVEAILSLSQALRAKGDPLSTGTLQAQVRQLQSGVTLLITQLVNAQKNADPRLELLSQALAGRFSLAMEQALSATARTGDTGNLELFAELGAEATAIDRLASSLGDTSQTVAQLRTGNADRTNTVRTGGTYLGGLSAYQDYDTLTKSLLRGIDDSLAAAASSARTQALTGLAVTLALLLLAIALAALLSRMMLAPINRVREGALEVANHSLPREVARIRAGHEPGVIEPIDVHTREEIGQLARAVDDLHRQAVTLASAEAEVRGQVGEMFVTLSRRNTTLVNQQLSLIESLERDEQDPKRLESLFRLDHLAARMRRTGDSLLILADAPSRSAGVEGLTVADAMRAATAGVQDYQRVQLGTTSDVRISPAAAADIVHLLTELVDNALNFSPPGSPVSISAVNSRDSVRIEIVDQGIGIPPDELEELNADLHSGGEVTLETARRMGLFVVSRLAQRHGVRAALELNGYSGTTATVVLPALVLPEIAATMPEEPLSRAALAAELEPVAPVAPVAVEPLPVEPSEQSEPVAVDASAEGHDEPAEPSVEEPVAEESVVEEPVAEEPVAEEPAAPAAPPMPQRTPFPMPNILTKAEGVYGIVPPPAEDEDEFGVEQLTNRINAALGLPIRLPGTAEVISPDPTPLAELAPQTGSVTKRPGLPGLPSRRAMLAEAAEAETAETAEVAEEPAPPSLGGLPTRVPAESFRAADFTTELPEPAAAEPLAEAPTYDEPAADEPTYDEESPAEPAYDQEPAVEEVEVLEQPAPAPVAAVALEEEDSPIFRALRSAWLTADESGSWSDNEVEAGWERAESVAEVAPSEVPTHHGLPMRQPGTRLVPGGVTKQAAAIVRDPEAIRARLAAHAAGVRRGRDDITHPAEAATEAGPA